ncbi:MAG: hypothetical protein LBN08_03390 [Lactobacillales bacterium]|jgi:hypothetical protein|nr:hypothetical protein [Lactobacillales bacterium]
MKAEQAQEQVVEAQLQIRDLHIIYHDNDECRLYKDFFEALLTSVFESKENIGKGANPGFWTGNLWKDNKWRVPSKSKRIYIGDTDDTKTLRKLVNIKYNDNGVKYGWVGNKLIIWRDSDVDDKFTESFEKLYGYKNKFLNFPNIAGTQISISDQEIKNSTIQLEYQKEKAKPVLGDLLSVGIKAYGKAVEASAELLAVIGQKVRGQDAKDAMFELALTELFMNGDLKEFLEN